MVQASLRNSQGSGVRNVSSEATTWATASAARSSTTVTVMIRRAMCCRG